MKSICVCQTNKSKITRVKLQQRANFHRKPDGHKVRETKAFEMLTAEIFRFYLSNKILMCTSMDIDFDIKLLKGRQYLLQ